MRGAAPRVLAPPAWTLQPRRTIAGIAVAAAYALSAQLGFRVAFVAEQVTTVWPPSGIAIAALLLWGARVWPAIWIGAFVANAMTSAPIWTAAPIATGNTLEAVAAVALLRFAKFDAALRRVWDAIAFLVIAGVASPTIAATIGVTTLCAAGSQAWSAYGAVWTDWALGDAVGALILAPTLLTLRRTSFRFRRRQLLETIVLVVSTLVVTATAFGPMLTQGVGAHPLEFVIFPFVITAAVRLRQPATSLVILAAAGVSIWNTVNGSGPFASGSVHQGLVLLQVYMGVLASSGLVLAAAITERRLAEQRQSAAHAVGQVLADSAGLEEAAPDVLRAMSDPLDCQLAALWTVDDAGGRLECVATSGMDDSAFVAKTRAITFARGVDLPGRVWAQGEPAWIEDGAVDVGERAEAARHAGLHGALGFPVRLGDEVVGVVEFFYTRVAMPDAGLLATVSTIGHQIGQFIGRTRVERERTEAEQGRLQLLTRERDARLEAEAANRAKDQFLATLSHELRTPLNAIVGWARMLLDDAVSKQNSRRALETIERNAQVQARLVADLLDVSGIITGRLMLDMRPVDLASVIGASVDAVRPAAEAKRIAIRLELPPEAVITRGDPARLQQVLWNLLSNAVKFTPQGGHVDVDLTDAGQHVRVDVRDSGPGIPPAFLPHVFERFRQGDGSSTRQHGGLGLGLAIVRHLVESHGGTVRAESPDGGGATFSVELPRGHHDDLQPIDQGPPRAVRGRDARSPHRLAGCRVLLVDDEEDARELFGAVLADAGAHVQSARSVREALTCLETNWPDVLLADIGMPDEDGYVLIRQVRALGAARGTHLPSAAVTAYGRHEDRRRARDEGFDLHVSKPVEPLAIVEAVASLWKPALT